MKFRRVLKVLTIATLLSTSMTSVAQAVPLVALVFGPVFAATIGGQILGAVVGAVASYLFSSLLGAIFPAEKPDTTQPDPAEVQYGERVSRSAIFGKVLIGGHVVHLNEYDDAKQLQYVGLIGDCWHTSIEKVKIAGIILDVTPITNSGNNETINYEVEDYEEVMDFRFHDGRPGQLADTDLVAKSPDWTSSKKYSNLAYFVADLKSDREKFSGIPDIQVVAKGIRCYDPRKDTTIGGSGPHRFADSTTWEYTENAAVQAYHYMRGFYFNGVRVLGPGYAASELSLAHFIAAMNVCDETVSNPSGGTHPRYACHMQVADTEQFGSVLTRFCDAMGGYYTDIAGQIAIFAGKAQSPVLTITDDDLIAEEDLTFNPGRPGEVVATGIQGTYMHSEDFQPTPYPTLEPVEFENPNWYPHIIEVNFDQIQHPHQAFLVAKQRLYGNRIQGTANIVLDIKDVLLQVNDWLVWDSATPQIGERSWKVIQVRYSFPKRRMYLSLAEADADVYDDDATPGDVQEPIRTLPPSVYITTVSNLDIVPLMLENPSGSSAIPALEFTYTPILDPGVLAVDIYYRTAADQPDPGDPAGPLFKVTDFSPADGTVRATNGVTPGMIHEAYALLIAAPGREVDTTENWVEALFPTGDFVASAEVPDGSITIAKLTADLQRLTSLLSSDGDGSVFQLIDELSAEIERQANAAYTNNANYARQTTLLSRRNSKVAAAVIFEQSVRITADEALAQAIIEVEAELADVAGGATAGGYLKFEAFVDEMSGVASIAAVVRASLATTYSEAAWILEAEVTGPDSTLSAFGVYADTFYVIDPTGSTMENAFVFTGGEASLAVARIEHIKAGLLTSADETSFIINLDDPEIYME